MPASYLLSQVKSAGNCGEFEIGLSVDILSYLAELPLLIEGGDRWTKAGQIMTG